MVLPVSGSKKCMRSVSTTTSTWSPARTRDRGRRRPRAWSPWHPQEHGHGLAQAGCVGADVQGGAVVVRLGDQGVLHGQPFTAPVVSPPTMNRCRIWNSTTVGIAASTAPAANIPKLLLRSPATRPDRPTARVLDDGSVRKTLAIRNSLTLAMKPSRPGAARRGE